MERRKTATPASNSRAIAAARAGVRPGVRTVSTSYKRPNTRIRCIANKVERTGAASPAESLMSINTTTTAGMKRKERDFDPDDGEATNINVVVRCRGRNEREVRENSAVVVETEGAKGKLVELSMGPSALSNKTYNFDRVFSPAADQKTVFEDVVRPILDEMLAGYNCTIFAYGQTGTGKTYTMSGDLSNTFGLLSDNAGIIPRVLHALFSKLEGDETENCVRCSFIELYNEELRDLLSADDGVKLKIFDDNSRKGQAATVVQGMEERHIVDATEGLRWLQEGSVRRQVAATKCNDLSSRSHTVFTITVYVKRPGGPGDGDGDDFVSAGKLNLVDLAGSENIQRSGAENKRAAEAGLINKSLLTLGRVINALVDRSAHIPYRESKLTRLLQDSLGGRTKTCIIATVSPAKSNVEETTSTLDYAFRAKNIRNKPQVNALINKKLLLRDFSCEIEKLKSELIATRQRNGVYLSNDMYEELTVQNESRRILTEEQSGKIENLESNLRSKVQELFSLTSSFIGLRREHESTKAQLDGAKEVLDQTEIVLSATRKSLFQETHLRKAHEATEEKLSTVGRDLIGAVQKTVRDVHGLHDKNRRRSDLQTLNRSTWSMSQARVAAVTELVEGRLHDFRNEQSRHLSSLSGRMQSFVRDEADKLASTQTLVDENLARVATTTRHLLAQREGSREEMDAVLEEIKLLRDHIKGHVGESLEAITSAAEKIASDLLHELTTFHTHLHSSYSALGQDLKSTFADLTRHMSAQKTESDRLRRQLEGASEAMVQSNATVSARIQDVLDEERRQAAGEREMLLAQITTLLHSQADLQESRLAGKTALIRQTVLDTSKTFQGSLGQFKEGMDEWDNKDSQLMEQVATSRDVLKTRLKDDWTTASEQSTSIQNMAKSVHAETIMVAERQTRDLDVQMRDLDNFVLRAKSQNAVHDELQAGSMQELSSTVERSFASMSENVAESHGRVRKLGQEMEAETGTLQDALEPLQEEMMMPLSDLRQEVKDTALREYEPTGKTPVKTQYRYPTSLPRTRPHDALVADLTETATSSSRCSVPVVFSDGDTSAQTRSPVRPDSSSSLPTASLREANPNRTPGSLIVQPSAGGESSGVGAFSLLKFQARTSSVHGRASMPSPMTRSAASKTKTVGAVVDGRENVPPATFSEGALRRKSPRLH